MGRELVDEVAAGAPCDSWTFLIVPTWISSLMWYGLRSAVGLIHAHLESS